MSAVEQVCLIVRLVEDNFNDGVHNSDLYVMRTGNSLEQGIQFTAWDDFRLFKSMKFSECWYRHLHTLRDEEFL